jgi:hypothetical protein
MRPMLAVAILSTLASLHPLAAHAGLVEPGVTGNDTGGIIAWTPDAGRTYKETAAAHCARWHRHAGITSVHRRYGDYIGFRCIDDRRYDPRKVGLPAVY